jgi:hypothetical protein
VIEEALRAPDGRVFGPTGAARASRRAALDARIKDPHARINNLGLSHSRGRVGNVAVTASGAHDDAPVWVEVAAFASFELMLDGAGAHNPVGVELQAGELAGSGAQGGEHGREQGVYRRGSPTTPLRAGVGATSA